MPRAGLAPAAVVAAGAALADEVGFTNVSMGLVAERVGVRTPSLYKHVDSLDALRRGIAIQAKRELGDALARATVGLSGPDAVRAFADAHRRWVLDHPGRYAATIRAPEADDEEDRRAGDDVLRILLDVLAGFGPPGAGTIDAARALRSALHGFASLESAGGFGLPRDVDRSYRFLVDTLITGLRPDRPTGAGGAG
ncbi:WHG domain-containing protein [Micromonospora sp. STR1_7]|uniref:WHG domain-containing protein n=1 Tax=Micromonospora parastrephiae TaxID=2806101 RepID=A0ABS1XVP4_9ACTN|nr:TetR-like C-terminal domain-containing protein [Micromonospora parastrephiae]MBM0233348.1 WHG domain-containing protein [Micromonospora parastrephiae]